MKCLFLELSDCLAFLRVSFSTPLAPPVTLPRLGAPLPLDRFPGMRPFCSGASGVDHTADSASGSPRAGHGGAGCSPGTLLGGLGGPGLGASRPSLHLGTQSRGPWLSLGSGSHPWPREPGDIRSLRKVSTLPATAAQGPCWPAPPHLLGAHSRLLPTAVSSCDQEQQSALEEARQPKNDNVVIPECAHGGLYKPVQCHPSTGYCWCVLVDTGRPIPGTSTR